MAAQNSSGINVALAFGSTVDVVVECRWHEQHYTNIYSSSRLVSNGITLNVSHCDRGSLLEVVVRSPFSTKCTIMDNFTTVRVTALLEGEHARRCTSKTFYEGRYVTV